MKKTFLKCAVVALLSSMSSVYAVDADMVRVNLDKELRKDIRVESKAPGGFGAKKGETGTIAWQYVAVPIEVIGGVKGSKKTAPDFVNELTLRVYLLFRGEKKGSYVMLDKEVTYVDIPLSESKEASKPAKGVMYGGVFISPRSARRLVEGLKKLDNEASGSSKEVRLGADEGSLEKYLVGVAIDVTRDGMNVMDANDKTSQPPFHMLRPDVAAEFKGKKWWLSSKGTVIPAGVALSAINETPFALDYAPLFPPVRPLVANVAGEASASATTAPAPTGGGTAVDEDTTVNDGYADDGDAPSSRKEKKDKKRKRSSAADRL